MSLHETVLRDLRGSREDFFHYSNTMFGTIGIALGRDVKVNLAVSR